MEPVRLMSEIITGQIQRKSWSAGSCRPWTRIPPPGSWAGHRRDRRCVGTSRAGGGGRSRTQGGWNDEAGGTTSPGRWGTPGGCARGGVAMPGIQGAGESLDGTYPSGAQRTAADTGTPDSGVCRASSPSSFAGSLPSRTCPQTRGPPPSSCPFDPRRFPWWAPSGNSRSGRGCASRCSANLFYPSCNTETWWWWSHKSLPGSAACPGSHRWPLQSEPRRSKVASAGGRCPAHLWPPGSASWSWCPGAALSARPGFPPLRPWFWVQRACAWGQTICASSAETGQECRRVRRCAHSSHRCILSSQRVPTVSMKPYWTSGEPERVETSGHKKVFITRITKYQIKTSLCCKQCLMSTFL